MSGLFLNNNSVLIARNIILVCFLILPISCNLKNRNDRNSNNIEITKVPIEESVTKKRPDWIDAFPQKIKSLRDSFYNYDLRPNFSSELIDKFVNSGPRIITAGLTPIDSTIYKLLFEDAVSKQNIDKNIFCGAFLYSIERPFMGFYPITIINPMGVVERPITLIIFDTNGNLLNSIAVADSFGEGGGYLESSFINDSTIIQKFRWEEWGVDSLGNYETESSFRTQKVIFNHSGTYRITEIIDQ